MNNLIASDLYRVRRGAALRNTFLGALAVVIIMVITVLLSQSESYNILVLENAEGMTSADMAELQQDLASASEDTENITNGATFGVEILKQSFIAFLFLPIVIAVFCADFTAGTYRNTLSFESNRTKVYLAKLLLSIGLSLLLVVATLGVSWLLGGIAFGFSGFSAAYFGRILTILLLQLPVYLAFVTVCHCLVAITKKSSSTIAIFLVGSIAIGVGLQTLAMAVPSLDWVLMLDPQSGGKLMAAYDTLSMGDRLIILGYNLAITIGATVLGAVHYRKTDMP